MTEAGYELIDPRDRQKEFPYTFFLPSDEEISEITPGILIKIIVIAVPSTTSTEAERLWVEITKRDGPHVEGILDNDPADIPFLKCGARLRFQTAPYH